MRPKRAPNYPPMKELPSVFLTAFIGLMVWLGGYGLFRFAAELRADPVVGCNQVGCAPGLVTIAGSLCYLVAAGLVSFAYLGLLVFLRRPLVITLFIIGGIGGVAAINALVQGFRPTSNWGWVSLFSPAFLIVSGLLAIWLQSQPPKTKSPRGQD